MENSANQLFFALSFQFLEYDNATMKLKQRLIKKLNLTGKGQLITGAQNQALVIDTCGQVNHNHKIQIALWKNAFYFNYSKHNIWNIS